MENWVMHTILTDYAADAFGEIALTGVGLLLITQVFLEVRAALGTSGNTRIPDLSWHDDIGARVKNSNDSLAASDSRTVAMTSVVRGGASSTGLVALFLLIGSVFGHRVLIDPVLALLIMLSSAGFYLMSYAQPMHRDQQ
jgi:hypothetical protein